MSAAYADDAASAGAAETRGDQLPFIGDDGDTGDEASTRVIPPDDDSTQAIAAPDYADPGFDAFASIDAHDTDADITDVDPVALGALEPATVFEAVPEPEAKPKRRHLFGRHRHDDDERAAQPQAFPDEDPPRDEPFDARTVNTSDGETVGRAQPLAGDGQLTHPPARRIAPDGEPGNTIEYDVEQAFLAEDKAEPIEGEDILEETPEFLADTPDHDRLWFEQKPPPDFDFDS